MNPRFTFKPAIGIGIDTEARHQTACAADIKHEANQHEKNLHFAKHTPGPWSSPCGPVLALDDEHLMLLDAEALAETGIKEAYEGLQATLKQYVAAPLPVEEQIDSVNARYTVTAGDIRYLIFSDTTPEADSWGNATYALFCIVNQQLAHSPYRFYAVNAGNDLGGLFLTQAQYQSAIASLKKRRIGPIYRRKRPAGMASRTEAIGHG